jgi:hypothetical protein
MEKQNLSYKAREKNRYNYCWPIKLKRVTEQK